MKIIKAKASLLSPPGYKASLRHIERAGRICYLSEPKGDPERFVRNLIRRGHESVLEHVSVSVKIVCSRGISHELVRHRLCSFSQSSTRYVKYADGEDRNLEMEFICPYWVRWDAVTNRREANLTDSERLWYETAKTAEADYLRLSASGRSPQMARDVLPNSFATRMIMTANIRQWRHVLRLRTSISETGTPHPDMVALMDLLLGLFYKSLPVFFEDLWRQYQERQLAACPTAEEK